MQETERLTLSLSDCLAKGVGVGLDPQNVVDMLVPGKTASEMLRIGDTVVLWNGISLTDPGTGKQRKLSSVVDGSLDTHSVVVERPLQPLTADEQTAMVKEATRRSGCETDGCEAGEGGGATAGAQPLPAEAPKNDWSEGAKEWGQQDWSAETKW